MTATVTTLKTPKSAASAAKASARAARAAATKRVAVEAKARFERRFQLIAAGAVATVDLSLMALSLTHQARGAELVTGTEGIQALLLAFGIDAGFVALELAAIAEPKISGSLWVKIPVIWCISISAVMNSIAFAEHAPSGLAQGGAVALGVTIPLLLLAGTHIIAKLLRR